jgi:hypothetical protein
VEAQRKLFLAALAAVAVAVGLVLVWPEAAERLAPEPARAWAAIEVGGNGLAAVGTAEIAAGTPFTLHAVLEATTRDGQSVYYTEAPRLVVEGREVAATALKRWDRRRQAKVLWFTVEGARPYLKAERAEDLERFQFTEFLRVDWPQTWVVPGRIDPAHDDRLVRQDEAEAPTFGTQRYQARIELYETERSLIPQARFTSPGAEARLAADGEIATASVYVPGGAAAASRFFGLSHLDPPADAPAETLALLSELTQGRWAFASVPLLARLIELAGSRPDELAFRRLDLDAALPWGREAAPGDLVQVGARWVVLYRDAGRPGVLDREDLCFDFARASAVRRLDQVFVGEGDVEVASLGVR